MNQIGEIYRRFMPIIMHNFDYNFHDKKQGALMEEMLMVGEILYSADDKDMKYTANMRAMTTYFISCSVNSSAIWIRWSKHYSRCH